MNSSAGKIAEKDRPAVWNLLAGVYFWISFVRLPATSIRDSIPQSWESVLSFAAAHHLQWGRDVIFTYGPLGFLASDYYWGDFFWPMLFWGFGFAFAVSAALVHFCGRLPALPRIAIYVAAPLLTTPGCLELGRDPIYFLSLMLVGIACLPQERPGSARLIAAGLFFAVLGSIKFTFSLYCFFAALVLVATHLRAGTWRRSTLLLTSGLAGFITLRFWTGQSLSNLLLDFSRSGQLASGYSSAMTLSADRVDFYFGVGLLGCITVLFVLHWFGSRSWFAQIDRASLIAAGLFLAWKEGFVRADDHVVVFLIFAFFLGCLLPAILGGRAEPDGLNVPVPGESGTLLGRAVRMRLAVPARTMLLLTAGTLLLALAPFSLNRKDFVSAVGKCFVPRFTDTVTGLFAPCTFKSQLEAQLESRRRIASLPHTRADLGSARVAVLSFDQDVAILNGLNYVPQPVFQNYSAYTPELQKLNENFFKSDEAPDYVLWRFATIDARFPTLDDGASALRILSAYTPVSMEGAFVLWKRTVQGSSTFSFGSETPLTSTLDQWVRIPCEPTWLRVDIKRTFIGAIQDFLFSSSEARIEVQLQDGKKARYRLPPGFARSGFLINPLLRIDADLVGTPSRDFVQAIRVYSTNPWYFQRSIRLVQQSVLGVARLNSAPTDGAPKLAVINTDDH